MLSNPLSPFIYIYLLPICFFPLTLEAVLFMISSYSIRFVLCQNAHIMQLGLVFVIKFPFNERLWCLMRYLLIPLIEGLLSFLLFYRFLIRMIGGRD